MAINKQSYQIVGMRQDNLVGTGASTKFAHEIMNLRLNTVGDYTTASWTTEEGTLQKSIEWADAPSDALALLMGNDTVANPIVPIGQAIINDQWIVFATQNLLSEDDPAYNDSRVGYDFIFKYRYQEGTNQLLGTILYAGDLNFDAKHPCETLAFYENDKVQKVYWTDGKNQPRVINIVGVRHHTALDRQFDFVQEVSLEERVDITKRTEGAGLFPPCTVKYCITYYKKYGQETNIVYDSPLYYPIKGQRACNPEELSGDSFEIKVMNIDDSHGFDYIRLYSIVRTSENATPIVRIVADKEIASLPVLQDETADGNPDNGYNPNTSKKYALFVDTNTTGEIVDPTVLQYIGGEELVAQTFAQKSNTMFLGNIELKRKSALEALGDESLLEREDTFNRFTIGDYTQLKNVYNAGGYSKQHINADFFALDHEKAIGIRTNADGGDSSFYQYSNQLTASKHWHSYSPDFGLFRFREHNGNSQRIKIFKYGETYRFGIQFQNVKGNWSEVIYLTDKVNDQKPTTDEWSSVGVFGIFRYKLPNAAIKELLKNDYVKARLVCCYPNNADRTILAQGVITNTIYNYEIAEGHAPDVMASWFFRPYKNGSASYDSNEVQSGLLFGFNAKINTINSPEIEIDESIRTLDLTGVSLSSVGIVPMEAYSSTYYVEAGSPMMDCDGSKGRGFVKLVSTSPLSLSLQQVREIGTLASYWEDMLVYNWDHGRSDGETVFRLYPFERNGSLNDYEKDVIHWVSTWAKREKGTGQKAPIKYPVTQSAKLEAKVFSNILYSTSTEYDDSPSVTDLQDIQIFDSNECIPVKLSNGLMYYGNLNIIAPLSVTERIFEWDDKENDHHAITGYYTLASYAGQRGYSDYSVSSVPIPITYNSIAHAVTVSEDSFTTNTPYFSLPVVDIKRNVTNRFGGVPSPNNIYLPCGPVVDLRECENETLSIHKSPILVGLEGDHYYQRYDCLKTYPRSVEDTNQIVEILSFMCETRINLDGRYDRNRGLSDNTTITNANFNLINKSYTQSNNFFTYTTLDEDASTLNKFANLITWTKDKVSGETVDTWTNITMASTADAEGVCGGINKIVNVNDTLYTFQDHGIAQIGYNEKTALSTLEGVPLEIANSGKFSGLTYVTKEIGCQNKWSISISKNGAFFIDDSRQELLTLGQGVTSLSTANGFDAFLIQQLPDSEHFTPWTPYNPQNFVSYYDKLGNDVLYINKDWCLAWNEQSRTFTSFYSYNNVPLMANIGTHLLMWDINTPLTFDLSYQEATQAETVWDFIESTTTSAPIYDDPNHLIVTFNHYIQGSNYNTGIYDTPTSGALIPVTGGYTPLVVWKSNTLENIRNSWVRMVVQPESYLHNGSESDSYVWNAHYILSLEFRKNRQPFIIQFEVEGVHRYISEYNHAWDVEPKPKVTLRTTTNVTKELIENTLRFFIGGRQEPTFQFGNIRYLVATSSYGGKYEKTGEVQPWDEVDSSFVTQINGVDREIVCTAKLYDLNGTVSDNVYSGGNPIKAWFITNHGNPFRTAYMDDSRPDIDADTADFVTNTSYNWEPRTVVKTNRIYTVNSESCSTNIWAARELVEDGQSICGKFFGHWQPYWITLVCDGMTADGNAFPVDKVFNNIEYRADVFDRITGLPRVDINLPVFDVKAAYNGYQAYKEFPIEGVRKFNTWRVQLPRATYYENGQFVTTRDRIRNPFCYIKLMNTNLTPLPNRMVLHDLAAYFDMK